MAGSRPDRGVAVSTVLGRKLGGELLRMREECGLKQPDAAAALSASVAKVAKIERGGVLIRDPDVLALCTLYEADAHALDSLLSLAKADRERRKAEGWWNGYPELRSQVEYVALEDVATHVRAHQLTVLPGLFQTPDYARALAVGCGTWNDPDEIERFVEARVARQERLTSPDPIHVWAVISEATLYQEVGDRDVLKAQLEHLLALTRLANVKLQVLPFRAGAHAGMAGAFNIVSFAEPGAMDVVHLDTTSSSVWLESEKDSARHGVIFDRVARRALAQADSRSLIRRAIKEI